MSNNPKVSVVTAVYRNVEQIAETIISLKNQTLQDYEHIVIDDCGHDGSIDVVRHYMKSDPRIKLFHNEKNSGIAATLNHGISKTVGEYISILDADDISLPNRLLEQTRFLDRNPEYGVVGSSSYHMDINSAVSSYRKSPITDLEIRFKSIFYPSFYHSSCTYRGSVIRQNSLKYDTKYVSSIDHSFWTELLKLCKGYNLVEPYNIYRMHSGSMSKTKRELTIKESIEISMNLLSTLGNLSSDEYSEIKNSVSIAMAENEISPEDMPKVVKSLNRVAEILATSKGINNVPNSVKAQIGKFVLKSIKKSSSPQKLLINALTSPDCHIYAGLFSVATLLALKVRYALTKPYVKRIRPQDLGVTPVKPAA
jgi:hypothetical protein